jgi:hypothetical protein
MYRFQIASERSANVHLLIGLEDSVATPAQGGGVWSVGWSRWQRSRRTGATSSITICVHALTRITLALYFFTFSCTDHQNQIIFT